MKKYKLQQWLPVVLCLVIFTSCSKKNYPAASNTLESTEKYADRTTAASNYTPPQVILISDQVAHINKEGEMYYDDAYGYRYWRSTDGKYYLDSKYRPSKKTGKKKIKKQRRQNNDTDYSSD